MRRSALLVAMLGVGVSWAGPHQGPVGQVLGREGIRHAGPVLEVAFDPSGRRLATCAASPHLRLWSLPGGDPIASFDIGAEFVMDLAWSPGGDALAVSDSNAVVSVLDVATGERIYQNRQHRGEVQRVAFLPDGTVASGGRTGLVVLHDLGSGSTTELWAPELSREETDEGPDYSRLVTDLLPTPDGEHLLVGDASGTLHVWELRTRRRIRRLDHVSPGRLSLRPGAGQVVVYRLPWDDEAAADGAGPQEGASLELLTVPELKPAALLRSGVDGNLLTTAFTPDGSTLLLGSHGTLEEIPMAGGAGRTEAFQGFPVTRLAFTPDGDWLAMAGGPEVRLEHRRTRTWMVASDGHRQPLAELVTDPQGRLHSLGAYQEYKVWSLREGLVLRSYEALTPYSYPFGAVMNDVPSPLVRAAPTRQGELLLFTGAGTLERRGEGLAFGDGAWNLYGGTCVATSSGVDLGAVGDERGRVRLLRPSAPSKGTRAVQGGHDGRVTALAVAGDGSAILSGGLDTRVRRIDPRARRSVALPAAHLGPVVDVELSRDGSLGASGGADRTVFLWDVPRGRIRATLGADSLDLSGWVALDPAGEVLAASSTVGVVRLFDTATGAARAELPAGVDDVGPVHFAPATGELLAATSDGTIRRWARTIWRSAWDRAPAPGPLR